MDQSFLFTILQEIDRDRGRQSDRSRRPDHRVEVEWASAWDRDEHLRRCNYDREFYC